MDKLKKEILEEFRERFPISINYLDPSEERKYKKTTGVFSEIENQRRINSVKARQDEILRFISQTIDRVREEERARLEKDLKHSFFEFLSGEDNSWRIERNWKSLTSQIDKLKKEKWEKRFDRKFSDFPGGVYIKGTHKPASAEDIKTFIRSIINQKHIKRSFN